MESLISKRFSRVNYEESNDHDEEEVSLMEVLDVTGSESGGKDDSFGQLNLKKQYRRAFIAAQDRDDWKILEEKNLPRGNCI